jgi:hypothetical protein
MGRQTTRRAKFSGGSVNSRCVGATQLQIG